MSTTTPIAWVGIDPGPRSTGIAARIGTRLIGWTVIDRATIEPDADRPGYPTLRAIIEAVDRITDSIGDQTWRVAVEDVVPPNAYHDGRLSIIDVTGLLRTAEIIGFVEAAYPDVLRVRPGNNGSNALASYPDGLVTATERRYAITKRRLLEPAPQNSTLRHARSAWDVAGAAAHEARVAAARAAAFASRPPRVPKPPRPARRRTATP